MFFAHAFRIILCLTETALTALPFLAPVFVEPDECERMCNEFRATYFRRARARARTHRCSTA